MFANTTSDVTSVSSSAAVTMASKIVVISSFVIVSGKIRTLKTTAVLLSLACENDMVYTSLDNPVIPGTAFIVLSTLTECD